MTVPFVVQPIVEGHGDVGAVPLLLRRIAQEIEPGRPVEVLAPIRVNRDRLVKDGGLERYVELAVQSIPPSGTVLVLVDADDDRPCELAPALLRRAEGVRTGVPMAVVLAQREFEAWFLAAATSLRSKRGLPDDLVPPDAPESIRDAKGWLAERRTDGYSYSPTADQPALAASMDLHEARAGASSFDKLWRDLERLMDAT